MGLSTALDFENCKQWCSNNTDCGGFTVYNYAAYFKDLSCKNSMFGSLGRSTFIKQEN